jgi:hypothetical protein
VSTHSDDDGADNGGGDHAQVNVKQDCVSVWFHLYVMYLCGGMSASARKETHERHTSEKDKREKSGEVRGRKSVLQPWRDAGREIQLVREII